MIDIGLQVRCENRFNDLGAACSKISTFFDQFIQFIDYLRYDSHAEFLSVHILKCPQNLVHLVHAYLIGLFGQTESKGIILHARLLHPVAVGANSDG